MTTQTQLPTRPFGKSGEAISVIGFGGIILKGMEQARADRVVAEAVERGVTYFDVAPTYGDAEVKLGPAIEPYRKRLFLACKTTQRQAQGVRAELKQSLEHLRTDHVDLYQLHAITHVAKDVDAVFSCGGAMEAFIEAKKEGRVRHLGFSAHSVEAAVAAMDRYEFDSILFPVNYATFYEGNFGPQVIAKAKARGVTRLALKSLASHPWPENDPDRTKFPNCWYKPLTNPRLAELALRWAFSQDITAAIPPGDADLFRLCVDIAHRLAPITTEEEREVRAMARKTKPIFVAGT